MSLIFTVYDLESGFVVGADGLCTNSDDYSVVSDKSQKIFPFEVSGKSLALAFMGAVGQTEEQSGKVVFDCIPRVLECAHSLSTRKCRDLAGFATRVCRPVNEALKQAKQSGALALFQGSPEESPGEGETIFRIFLQGYFESQPAQVSVRFFHRNQILQHPDVTACGGSLCYGSPIIAKLIEGQDPRFTRYETRESDFPDKLSYILATAKNQILACSDPEALLVDPVTCRAIGGHIHIGTITPAAGFKWIAGFEPINEPRAG